MKKMFVLSVISLVFAISPAQALQSEWAVQDYVQARVISAESGVNGKQIIQGAFEIKLAEGWHAYWRMPGDGGLPPRFDWSGSDNITAVDVHWPAPDRFTIMDLQSFGYKDSVLLPLTMTLEDIDAPAEIKVEADIMVCEDICVPQTVNLALSIPAQALISSPHSKIVENAFDRLPASENNNDLKIESVVLGPEAIVVNVYARKGFKNTDLFVDAGEEVYITAQPEIEVRASDERHAMIWIAAPEGSENLANLLADKEVTLTLVIGRDALERSFRF